LIIYKYEWFTGQKGCYNSSAGQFDREAKVGNLREFWGFVPSGLEQKTMSQKTETDLKLKDLGIQARKNEIRKSFWLNNNENLRNTHD